MGRSQRTFNNKKFSKNIFVVIFIFFALKDCVLKGPQSVNTQPPGFSTKQIFDYLSDDDISHDLTALLCDTAATKVYFLVIKSTHFFQY